MLRLIGAIVVILLILVPLLLRIGVPDHTGLLNEFVDLETHAITYVVDTLRNVWDRYG